MNNTSYVKHEVCVCVCVSVEKSCDIILHEFIARNKTENTLSFYLFNIFLQDSTVLCQRCRSCQIPSTSPGVM